MTSHSAGHRSFSRAAVVALILKPPKNWILFSQLGLNKIQNPSTAKHNIPLTYFRVICWVYNSNADPPRFSPPSPTYPLFSNNSTREYTMGQIFWLPVGGPLACRHTVDRLTQSLSFTVVTTPMRLFPVTFIRHPHIGFVVAVPFPLPNWKHLNNDDDADWPDVQGRHMATRSLYRLYRNHNTELNNVHQLHTTASHKQNKLKRSATVGFIPVNLVNVIILAFY